MGSSLLIMLYTWFFLLKKILLEFNRAVVFFLFKWCIFCHNRCTMHWKRIYSWDWKDSWPEKRYDRTQHNLLFWNITKPLSHTTFCHKTEHSLKLLHLLHEIILTYNVPQMNHSTTWGYYTGSVRGVHFCSILQCDLKWCRMPPCHNWSGAGFLISCWLKRACCCWQFEHEFCAILL
jgi:hypothetical protein